MLGDFHVMGGGRIGGSAANIFTRSGASDPPAASAQATQLPRSSVRVENSTLPAKIKTTSNVNLRKSATAPSKRLHVIPRGTILIPLQRASSGWYNVKHKQFIGWVSNNYVSSLTASKTPTKPAAKPFTQKFDQYRDPNRTKRSCSPTMIVP